MTINDKLWYTVGFSLLDESVRVKATTLCGDVRPVRVKVSYGWHHDTVVFAHHVGVRHIVAALHVDIYRSHTESSQSRRR